MPEKKDEKRARLLHELAELTRTWERDGFKLELFDLNRQDSTGHHRCGYCFYDGGKLIFATRLFGVPYTQSVDGDWAVVSALLWVSLRPGDADREFFESYTPEQLEWTTSDRCQELQTLHHDLEQLIQSGIRCKEDEHDVLTCTQCTRAYWSHCNEKHHRGQDRD